MGQQKEKGFTLVEVMVALVILAVGMLAIGSMLISNIRFNQGSEHRIDGAGIAQSVMADALRQAESAGYSGGTVTFSHVPSGQAVVSVVNGPTVSGSGRLIRVVFTWDERGQTKTIELRSWGVTP